MSKEPNPPSIGSPRFDCPYCRALSHQYWYKLNTAHIQSEEQWQMIHEDIIDKNVIRIVQEPYPSYGLKYVNNLFVSQCYSCDEVAIWVNDRLVYPQERSGVEPNQDLPEDIIFDFQEARTIVDFSPRGAAALMRLALQKLCKHLGEKGKNINEDIKSLVSKGLNSRIQKMFDIIRVVGNEAVHPGELDLDGDKDTVVQLFDMVNLIAEQMISLPKSIQEAYDKLSESNRNAIDVRDKPVTSETKT